MKILWFSLSPCGSLRRNNAEYYVQGWMQALEDELKRVPDIELSVAYFSEMKENPFLFENVRYFPMGEKRKGNPFSRLLDRWRPSESVDREKLEMMLDVIRQSQPDLIHIHGTEDAFGLVADVVKDIPIIFSIQGLIAPITEKFLAGISKETVKKFSTFRDKIHHVTTYQQYLMFKKASKRECSYLSKAKYVFGRTSFDERCTLALNPDRMYFVMNELLRNEFYGKNWKGTFSQDGKVYLVSTISSMLYKGLETVIKTANILKQYSHIDFRWDIVGLSGNENYVRMAEYEAGVRSIECNVNFLGKKPASALADILCNADIYIHPSHIENSPNSVCEAMLVGLPVIATNVGGTSSMLKDGVEGVLVQDGDPYELAGAIIEIQKDPQVACLRADVAKKTAIERHEKSKVLKELLSAYKFIVNGEN